MSQTLVKNDSRICANKNIVFYDTPGATLNTTARPASHTAQPAPNRYSHSHDIPYTQCIDIREGHLRKETNGFSKVRWPQITPGCARAPQAAVSAKPLQISEVDQHAGTDPEVQ